MPRTTAKRFTEEVLLLLQKQKILRIRAGTQHRFIGIWCVVVERRVFVRSWYMKPRSWYRSFLEDPHGAIEMNGREIPVRAVRIRSDRLRDAVDQAYLDKYTTPANLQYARGFSSATHRETTTELAPE